jgi:exodeoxyribonuclease VII small subunit
MAKDSDGKKPSQGFEQRLQRLEKLAEKLREGSIPLEEAIALFEEGMKLSKALEKDLARVERRVQILTSEPGGEDEEPGMELFPDLEEEE